MSLEEEDKERVSRWKADLADITHRVQFEPEYMIEGRAYLQRLIDEGDKRLMQWNPTTNKFVPVQGVDAPIGMMRFRLEDTRLVFMDEEPMNQHCEITVMLYRNKFETIGGFRYAMTGDQRDQMLAIYGKMIEKLVLADTGNSMLE